jgi:hypothetical protein
VYPGCNFKVFGNGNYRIEHACANLAAARLSDFLPCAVQQASGLGSRHFNMHSVGGRKLDKKRGDLRCSFCDKNQDVVDKLIAGPGVYICNFCVANFNVHIADANYQGVQGTNCSFCGKQAKIIGKIISSPKARICDECMELCNEILDESLFKA